MRGITELSRVGSALILHCWLDFLPLKWPTQGLPFLFLCLSAFPSTLRQILTLIAITIRLSNTLKICNEICIQSCLLIVQMSDKNTRISTRIRSLELQTFESHIIISEWLAESPLINMSSSQAENHCFVSYWNIFWLFYYQSNNLLSKIFVTFWCVRGNHDYCWTLRFGFICESSSYTIAFLKSLTFFGTSNLDSPASGNTATYYSAPFNHCQLPCCFPLCR